MIRIAVLVAGLLAIQSAQDEQPEFPPFKVVITGNFKDVPDGDKGKFKSGLAELQRYAKLTETVPAPNDLMNTTWKFEVPGKVKFDPSRFWHVFVFIKTKSYKFTMTGNLTQEAQTKKMFITSLSGKTKVKLVNRPKKQFDTEESEDKVGKMSNEFDQGKVLWEVTGELFSQGGTLAIILESYKQPPAPPKPKTPPPGK